MGMTENMITQMGHDYSKPNVIMKSLSRLSNLNGKSIYSHTVLDMQVTAE